MGKWTDKELMAKFKIKLDSRENLEEVSVRNPKIISFYAEKGGVGKTTTCLNLAHTFAKNGKRVLIYDCDVQRSLTAWTFGNTSMFRLLLYGNDVYDGKESVQLEYRD